MTEKTPPPATYGPAYVKREALRRRMRKLGVYGVPPLTVLDRVVEEHEVAAALVGRMTHDELCELATVPFEPACYCADRYEAVDEVVRRLDARGQDH